MGILTVGTVALDTIETPFGSVEGVLGGSATYIALAARYFVDDVRLVAVVGNDFPDRYTASLRRAGIDLQGLSTDPDGYTFAWSGRYHYDLNQRDTLSTDLNVIEHFDPVLPGSYVGSRVVCLGNLDPDIQCSVLDQVGPDAFVLCDTMNFWIEKTPEALGNVLHRVDCLVINESEARQLSGQPNLIKAARLIRENGPSILVIKKGEHGALLFMDGIVFSVPAYPLEDLQDPTGAGDAFMGGFAGYLSTQDNISADALKQGLVFGSAVASFSVEHFGPNRLFDLEWDEILDRVASFRELTSIPVSKLA